MKFYVKALDGLKIIFFYKKVLVEMLEFSKSKISFFCYFHVLFLFFQSSNAFFLEKDLQEVAEQIYRFDRPQKKKTRGPASASADLDDDSLFENEADITFPEAIRETPFKNLVQEGIKHWEDACFQKDENIMKTALLYFLKASEKDPIAQFFIAFCKEKELFLKKDPKRAVDLYALAHGQAYFPASIGLYRSYCDSEQKEQALSFLKEALIRNPAHALICLTFWYDESDEDIENSEHDRKIETLLQCAQAWNSYKGPIQVKEPFFARQEKGEDLDPKTPLSERFTSITAMLLSSH